MHESISYGGKVIVGLDGSSNAVAAFSWALSEARARHTSVEAVYVWQVPSLAYSAPGYIPMTEDEIDDQAQGLFSAALAECADHDDVKVWLRAAEGAPVEVLTEAARDPDVAMVVVGARGHGGVAGLLLGSVSHSLTHKSPKPIAVVVRDWRADSPEVNRRRIVVGVDGSAGSARALAWATHDARARGVVLEVVTAWMPPAPALPPHLAGRGDVSAERRSKLEAMLRTTIETVDTTGLEVVQSVVEGQPARALTERARSAQLLVVGTRGRGWAREAVLGSVSHACTHNSVVPVVVVPTAPGDGQLRG
jgi:nucleotide-binding universal stress UspA family protein